MKTKIGKALVGLSFNEMYALKEAFAANDEKKIIKLLMECDLTEEEYQHLLIGVEEMYFETKEILDKVFESQFTPPKKLTHTICPELCCEGVPTKYGPGRPKLTKTVVNKDPKRIKLVVVDKNGKEL